MAEYSRKFIYNPTFIIYNSEKLLKRLFYILIILLLTKPCFSQSNEAFRPLLRQYDSLLRTGKFVSLTRLADGKSYNAFIAGNDVKMEMTVSTDSTFVNTLERARIGYTGFQRLLEEMKRAGACSIGESGVVYSGNYEIVIGYKQKASGKVLAYVYTYGSNTAAALAKKEYEQIDGNVFTYAYKLK